jgi:hypothetical protein
LLWYKCDSYVYIFVVCFVVQCCGVQTYFVHVVGGSSIPVYYCIVLWYYYACLIAQELNEIKPLNVYYKTSCV